MGRWLSGTRARYNAVSEGAAWEALEKPDLSGNYLK